MDFIEVEIVSWGKHQRKDVTKPSWFAVSNRILEDAKMYGLHDSDWKVLLYIFCQASQQNKNTPKIFFAHAERICGLSKSKIESGISRLCEVGVTCTSRAHHADVALQDKTGQDKTRQDSNAHAEAFALFWSGYPNKKGRSRAEILFRKISNSGETPENLIRARDRYKEQLKREGTEPRYILHGPTFLGRYRDFLDPEYGKAEDFSTEGPVDFRKIAEGRK